MLCTQGDLALQMVGYGQLHKQVLKKEWEAFYVNYDLLQHMLQRYIDSPGQTRIYEATLSLSNLRRRFHYARVPASISR